MYSTAVYNIIPRQQVVVYSGNSTRRYKLVYAKNLQLNKGVDNKIQFQFLNQEQKPVDITGKEISFRLISYDGTSVLLRKALTPTLPLTGLSNLIVTAAELINIDTQYCSYSLEIPDGDLDVAVFVDSEAGARGQVQLVNSVLPSHVPSHTITIPSHGPISNVGLTYYSSVFNTKGNSVMTIQSHISDYSGDLQIQGSTTLDIGWYNIGPTDTFDHETATLGHTIEGFHPYVRLKFVSTSGVVPNILIR